MMFCILVVLISFCWGQTTIIPSSGTPTSFIWNSPVAGCQGDAFLLWDTPVSGAATAACVVGPSVKGVAEFGNAAAQAIETTLQLPTNWNSGANVAVKLVWYTTETSGFVEWNVATACSSDADTDTVAYNTASVSKDEAKGTASQRNVATIAALSMTGCVAGDTLHVKVSRNPADADDTVAGTAQLEAVVISGSLQ